jgi:uncharacterized protein YhaN
MRLESVHIDGFGIFHDESIEGFAAGLTIIEGANESGKSTLMLSFRVKLGR